DIEFPAGRSPAWATAACSFRHRLRKGGILLQSGADPRSAADPPGRLVAESLTVPSLLSWRTALSVPAAPRLCVTEQPVFLARRLHGSLPLHRSFPGGTLQSGQAFA